MLSEPVAYGRGAASEPARDTADAQAFDDELDEHLPRDAASGGVPLRVG
jgi:hypothetical protein